MSSRWSRHSEYRNLELYPLWSVQGLILHRQLSYCLLSLVQGQYETVFEAVLVFLDSFDTYSNFGQ